MKRIFVFASLFFLSSCAKDEFILQTPFIYQKTLNLVQSENQSLTPGIDGLKSQFGNNVEALIRLQIGALKRAKATGRITIPENPSESDLVTVFSILTAEGFLNQADIDQLTASVNSDLQTLSANLSQNELEELITNHALIAIRFSSPGGASLLPCYDDYEANILGITIGYTGCLIFSGGIPGGAVCTMLYAAGVIVIEEQFENCLQNTYPNGNAGN